MQNFSKGQCGPSFLLVFGMARSGTSWIGKIFDSHPLTLYKHEPDRTLPAIPMAPSLADAEDCAPAVRDFFRRLPTINQTHVAGSLPIFAKSYRSLAAQQIHKLSVLSSIALASSIHSRIPVLHCARLDKPEIRIVWKSIDSLGRLGIILEIMENTRAILLTRHPCASISSTIRGQAQKKFSSSVPPSEDYGIMRVFLDSAVCKRGLTEDHLRQLHPIERMAWIWILINEKAFAETCGNSRCVSVRYEDVCSNPEDKMKELFALSELSWDEQTSSFIKASTLGAQPSKFDQFTQDSRRYYGIFRDPIRAAEKWKKEMKTEDIKRVYRVLRQSDLIDLYPESEESAVGVGAAVSQ